jgi:hypothetical protein
MEMEIRMNRFLIAAVNYGQKDAQPPVPLLTPTLTAR